MHLGQAGRDLDQHLVPDIVAERVVDDLEAVEIDEEHREAIAGFTGMRDGAVDPFAEACPVRQARQLVVVGEVLDVGLRAMALGDIDETAAQARDPVVGTELGLDAAHEPSDFAAHGDHAQLVTDRKRPADGVPQESPHARTVVLVDRPEEGRRPGLGNRGIELQQRGELVRHFQAPQLRQVLPVAHRGQALGLGELGLAQRELGGALSRRRFEFAVLQLELAVELGELTARASLGHLHRQHGLVGFRVRSIDLLQQVANGPGFDPVPALDLDPRPAQLQRQQGVRWLALQSPTPWQAGRDAGIHRIFIMLVVALVLRLRSPVVARPEEYTYRRES